VDCGVGVCGCRTKVCSNNRSHLAASPQQETMIDDRLEFEAI
jgi:hypothetical protein